MSFRKRNSHTKSKRADSTKIHVVVRVRPRIAEDLDSTIHKRPGASAYEECVEEDEARSSVFVGVSRTTRQETACFSASTIPW